MASLAPQNLTVISSRNIPYLVSRRKVVFLKECTSDIAALCRGHYNHRWTWDYSGLILVGEQHDSDQAFDGTTTHLPARAPLCIISGRHALRLRQSSSPSVDVAER